MSKNLARDYEDYYYQDYLDDIEENENRKKPSGWNDKRYRNHDYSQARRNRKKEKDELQKNYKRENW